MREMKDSNVSWMKMVPADWKIKRIKHLFSILSGATPKSEISEYWDGEVLWITPADYKTKDRYVNGGKRNITQAGLKSCSATMIPAGSLIFSKRAPIGTVSINSVQLSTNQGCLSCVDKIGCNTVFYYYVMSICTESFELLGSGTTFKEISANSFANFPVPFPSFIEQKTIADFLDAKCSEIDALCADIQTQIDVLEQYKRSVITEAVTKGLNPDVEMKDSRIAWVPKLPIHWEVVPSKYLFHSSNLRKQLNDELLTASQKYGIITQAEYMQRENASVVLANKGLENWKHVTLNDFIISLRSFQGGLEMSETTGCITWHYIVLKANRPVYHRYYKWVFKCSQYINALQGTCNFIRDGQDLRFSNFAKVPLFVPPIEEQRAIAEYLENRCAEIDAIIADKQSQLATLDEYKKSLIFEYVTGKKEVTA